jgi:hypothetical protein
VVAQIAGQRFELDFVCNAKLLQEQPASVISIPCPTGCPTLEQQEQLRAGSQSRNGLEPKASGTT